MRTSLKIALTALTLGIATVSASTFATTSPAAAGPSWGPMGGWGSKHHHWNHHGHRRFYAPLAYGSDCYRVYRKVFVPGVGRVARRVTVCD
jgi:hypothetical protein